MFGNESTLYFVSFLTRIVWLIWFSNISLKYSGSKPSHSILFSSSSYTGSELVIKKNLHQICNSSQDNEVIISQNIFPFMSRCVILQVYIIISRVSKQWAEQNYVIAIAFFLRKYWNNNRDTWLTLSINLDRK